MTNPRLYILGLKKEKRLAWLFVLPTLTLVVSVYAYPILTTLVYSVTKSISQPTQYENSLV